MTNVSENYALLQITIPSTCEVSGFINYDIKINVGDMYWKVSHRYKEFLTLHEHLVKEHGIATDILPPKKVIGNKEPSFIQKRQVGLETYLNTVVRLLQKNLPRELVRFLLFDDYDVLLIVRHLAEYFFQQGESILNKSTSYSFTPIQLHAISLRLRTPCPDWEVSKDQQFSHVLDFCSQITELTVIGSREPLKNSNIVINNLDFDLTAFKILQRLNLSCVDCSKIKDLGLSRSTIKHLQVLSCNLDQLSDILSCDQLHKTNIDQKLEWTNLTNLNCSKNNLKEIDESIKLAPHLQTLTVENNLLKLTNLSNLHCLTDLMQCFFSTNFIDLPSTHELNIKRLVHLDLAQNKIRFLSPFKNLLSLQTLDLRSNLISDVEEVTYLVHLPCLENIILTGNPVSTIVDYRIKVLELFGNRVFEVCLDNESTNQKELDKVAIFTALKSVSVKD